jgi:phosphoglucosamine mutase
MVASPVLVEDKKSLDTLVQSDNNPLKLQPKLKLFGTDGIRGKAGQFLTPALALQVGFWAGTVLRQVTGHTGALIMGQDSRSSGDMLAMSLSAGLTAAGLEVWHIGLCPTPTVAYLTHKVGALGGVMISASHNPPEDNGIKFFGADGAKLSMELQSKIEMHLCQEGMEGVNEHTWGRHCFRPELTHSYVDALQEPFEQQPLLQGMKIVLDLAWGAATHLAPIVFERMGAEVITLHDVPDGACINVNCGSTHLDPLKDAVKAHQADLGFAFDGDADRVLAVDCIGRTVDGDYILYLWGQSLKQQSQLPGNLIVATVMSNLGFERAWQKQGGQLIRAAVGDQYVHAEMIKNQAILGGEQSGHILCRRYGIGGDGLQTALHIAAIVQQSGMRLRDLVDSSFQTYPQTLKNVRVEDRERRGNWQQCEPLMQKIAQAEVEMGDSGRVLVRASGTEPLIRVMVEAADAAVVTHWCDTITHSIEHHLVG